MQHLDELFNVLSAGDYTERFLKAKATSTCIACGKPVQGLGEFSARLQYQVSAICQCCQDRYFAVKRRKTGP